MDVDFHPKLGDFGLSRLLMTTQASVTNLTGTPAYMAPEQFLSDAKHIPIKSDVYSFGMLLYELATNKVTHVFFFFFQYLYLTNYKVPFAGLNPYEVPRMLAQGDRPALEVDS